MAVENTANPQTSLPHQPPLPDYPQMIMSAIEGLNEKEGSSKLAISNYIESSYSDLTPAHTTLLSSTLEKLKQSGNLVFSNGNYLKASDAASEAEAEGDAPVKRGRGRPPKSKDPIAQDAVPASPRPRGRPPKARDPLAPAAQPKKVSSAGSGRSRGRPRKYPTEVVAEAEEEESEEEAVEAVAPAAVTAVGVKRGRGRPPKVKP